jgi:parallel beta-helix repeat protein
LSILAAAAMKLPAATFVVTNRSDTGAGTLRQAILDANASPDEDVIELRLQGASPWRIQPLSALPDVRGPVLLDGTTQAGFSGQPLVELRGELAGEADGLRLAGGFCTVQGLVINRFQRSGLRLLAGTNVIRGNFIGTDLTGKLSVGNGEAGIDMFLGEGGNRIGGGGPGDRNVIGGNRWGIYVVASDNIIQGNLVGVDIEGQLGLGNLSGLTLIRSSRNQIGGLALAEQNVVAGNLGNGIELLGSSVDGSSANSIQGNFIASNSFAGIVVEDSSGNAIRGNRIFGNGALGIDLDGDDATPNDDDDSDTGANQRQNFPQLISSSAVGELLIVQGNLRSRPQRAYALEFFLNPVCDPSGFGEGYLFLGGTNVFTAADGVAGFELTFSNDVTMGWSVTATATDDEGNTSEFSPCLPVMEIPLVVPVFRQSPLSQSAVVNGSVTFSAAITGEPPPYEYELRRGTTSVTTNRSSDTNVFFTLTNLQPTQAGLYRVIVRNAATSGAGVGSSVATLTVLADTDGDGMPDAFEIAHGFSTNNLADAARDDDGDGASNVDEFNAGTSPTNALSSLRLLIAPSAIPTPNVALTFTAISNKTYRLQTSDEPVGAAWSNLLRWVARPTNTSVTTTSLIGVSRGYYRVVSP